MSVLTRKVLVMNKNWIPIRIITVRRAMIILFTENKALVVDNDEFTTLLTIDEWVNKDPGEYYIRTSHKKIKIPEVIILTNCTKIPKQPSNFNKKYLEQRDGHSCQYCNKLVKGYDSTIDHIIPTSRGGKTSWDNCVISCRRCNNYKSDRLPSECGLKLLSKPHKPSFINMFESVGIESWKRFIK